jgi:hypothetical protein
MLARRLPHWLLSLLLALSCLSVAVGADDHTTTSGTTTGGTTTSPPSEDPDDEEDEGSSTQGTGEGNETEGQDEDASEDEEDGDGPEDTEGEDSDDAEDSEGEDSDEAEDDEERDDDDAFRGSFAVNGSSVQGTHVTFTAADGGLRNYTVDGVVVAAAIDFEPALSRIRWKVEGAELKVEGNDVEFRAVDTPNGHFRAEADDLVRVTLAPGFSARDGQGHDDSRVLLAGPGNVTGAINGDRLRIVGNGTVVEGRDVRFLLHPLTPRTDLSDDVREALEDGDIGAEVVVEPEDGGTVVTPVETGVVNVTVADTEGRVFLTVEGHGNGTALLFTLAPGVLGDPRALVVRFDGLEIAQAADMADLLDVNADEPADYLVVVGANATQVLVAIPHFSIHTIELASGSAQLVPSGLQLTAFLAAGTVAAAFVALTAMRRPRQR